MFSSILEQNICCFCICIEEKKAESCQKCIICISVLGSKITLGADFSLFIAARLTVGSQQQAGGEDKEDFLLILPCPFVLIFLSVLRLISIAFFVSLNGALLGFSPKSRLISHKHPNNSHVADMNPNQNESNMSQPNSQEGQGSRPPRHSIFLSSVTNSVADQLNALETSFLICCRGFQSSVVSYFPKRMHLSARDPNETQWPTTDVCAQNCHQLFVHY